MHQPIDQRLSVVAGALSPDPRQSPKLARQLGFRGILFDAVSSHLNITELSQSGRRDFRQTLGASDLRLLGLQLDLDAKGLSLGADIDRQIARLDRAMESAAGLGAPLLCVDIGPLPPPAIAAKPRAPIDPALAGNIIVPQATKAATEPPPSPPPDPAFVSQVNSALAEIGLRADRYSVIVAFSSALASFASLDQALSAARCPWFGVDLDPLAILRDHWSIDDIFTAMGPLVRHMRVRDASVGAEKRLKPAPIGAGDVNWPRMLGLLDESDYQGSLTLDPMEMTDRARAAKLGADFLRTL